MNQVSTKKKQINIHPVNHLIVGELENELINDAVNALGSTNQFQLGVRRIVENEVVLIEMRQGLAANAAGHLRYCGQCHSTEIFLS